MKFHLFTFLICQITIAQTNNIDIARTICKCEPAMTYELKNGAQLLYLSTEHDENSRQYYQLNIIENIGQRWTKVVERNIIDNDVDRLNEILDTPKIINVEGRNLLFIIIETGNTGTAFNGRSIEDFVFYDIEKDTMDLLQYCQWNNSVLGDFKLNDKPITKNALKYIYWANIFLEKYYKQNVDINSPQNIGIKWKSMNENVYEQIKNINIWHKIESPKYNKDFFEKHLLSADRVDSVYENEEFKVFVGFKEPCYAYSKIKKESYIIWIPEGWPAGGGWGARSLKIKSLNREFLYFSDSENNYTFNLHTNEIKLREK